MKKIISVITAIMLLMNISVFFVSADFQNTNKNTDNYRENIIGVAKTQVGYSENSDGTTKYGDRFYVDDGDSWQTSFISWCAEQAGITSSVIPYTSSVYELIDRFEETDTVEYSSYLGSDYVPQKGDLIFFTTQSGDFSSVSEVGIISETDVRTLSVIIGDRNDSVVCETHDINENLILCYGKPDYSEVVAFSIGRYKTTAERLNFRTGPSADYSKVRNSAGDNITIPADTVLDVIAISGGWGYTQFSGKFGWICLDYAYRYSELPEVPKTDPEEMQVKWNVIDVSVWQGDINWAKVADDNIQAAIIRIGARYVNGREVFTDTKFAVNYNGASAEGIPVGCYFYTTARSESEAAYEASYVLEILRENDCKLEMPVFFDIEDDSMRYLGARNLSAITDAFCSVIEDAGYLAGVYCSKSWAEDYLYDYCLENRAVWIAQWSSSCTYGGDYGLWQYTDSGNISGIPENYVDLSICYINYPYFIKSNGLNGFGPQEPVQPVIPPFNPEPPHETIIPGTHYTTTITPAGCSLCGKTIISDTKTSEIISSEYTSPDGHTAGEMSVDGKVICTACGKELISVHPEHKDHTFTMITLIEPTCESDGLGELFCEDCGGVNAGTCVINSTGHTPSEEKIVESDCTTDGSVTSVCETCGKTVKFERKASDGHFCKSWQVISKPAQDGREGLKRGYCDICEKTVYVVFDYTYNGKYSFGDSNGDGKITTADAKNVLRYSASLISFYQYQLDRSDMNRDGKVTTNDAKLLLRKIAGIE